YQLELGPQILSASGAPLDEDLNGVAGDAGDRVVTSFNIEFVSAPPYTVAPTPFLPVTLNPSDPDVITLHGANGNDVSNGDDDFPDFDLAGHSFNFFGTTYSHLFISVNGLITFGSPDTFFTWFNTDLTTNPTEAAIAVYWDDLVTGINGVPDDLMLAAFRDV